MVSYAICFVAESIYIAGMCSGKIVLWFQCGVRPLHSGLIQGINQHVRKRQFPWLGVIKFCLHVNRNAAVRPGTAVCHFCCDSRS